MGSSHQTQGGKCSANLPLSRSCKERRNSLSQNARRLVNPLHKHLRGKDDEDFKLLQFSARCCAISCSLEY